MDPSDPAYAGQKDYSKAMLAVYDWWVMGVMSRIAWKIDIPEMVEFYGEHITPNHLDVGPGTGFLIDEADLPDGARVVLLDPNLNVLEHASKRLARLSPETVEADVLKPLPVEGPFDSACLANVLHCLPGPIEAKSRAFENIAAVLAPDGVLAGSTVLGESADHNGIAKTFLKSVNKRGSFDNLGDSPAAIREILEASFEEVEVTDVGSMAYFMGRRPKRPSAA